MDQTNVGSETQETETGLPATPNQGATLVRGVVEGRSIISSPTSAPPEVPAVNPHLLLDTDIKLFQQGTHFRLQEKLGAHSVKVKGVSGVQFAVWAPNAERVSVMGEFNQWDRKSHPLRSLGDCGIWEGFVPEPGPGRATSISSNRDMRVIARRRPTRLRFALNCHPEAPPSSGTSTMPGAIVCG